LTAGRRTVIPSGGACRPCGARFPVPPPSASYTLSLHDALPIYSAPMLGVRERSRRYGGSAGGRDYGGCEPTGAASRGGRGSGSGGVETWPGKGRVPLVARSEVRPRMSTTHIVVTSWCWIVKTRLGLIGWAPRR